MKATFKPILYPDAISQDIPITQEILAALQSIDKTDLRRLFWHFRFNLQSRIPSLPDEELGKLKSKIEYLDELERFFLSLQEKI